MPYPGDSQVIRQSWHVCYSILAFLSPCCSFNLSFFAISAAPCCCFKAMLLIGNLHSQGLILGVKNVQMNCRQGLSFFLTYDDRLLETIFNLLACFSSHCTTSEKKKNVAYILF